MKTDFRTSFQLPKSNLELNHKDSILLLGSCFSENIGNKLGNSKFDCIINPLGISYNPISIHNLLGNDSQTNLATIEQDGIYFNHKYHSSFNNGNQKQHEIQIETQHNIQTEQLNKRASLIITYGTAWVYELKSSNTIVNNCHKRPALEFNKRLLTVEEIVNSWKNTLEYLSQHSNLKNIIFTVSPVRHTKDGVRENQLSKSILHLAIHEICLNHRKCSYFPSYEIMMDDLRDYRFYKDDFLHPNPLAINYIWDKFSEHFFSNTTRSIMKEIEKLNTALSHKAFHVESSKHQGFLKSLKVKIEAFQAKHQIDFNYELSILNESILG